MLGADDDAIYVGPYEGSVEPSKAWCVVRGSPHRVRRSWSPSPSALGSSGSSARDVQRDTSVKTMNKRRGSRNRHEGGLAREYRFDYSKSRPNRFARQVAKNAVV